MRIEVIMSPSTFRRFSIFNTMHKKKAWKSPAIFATILSVCAAICYIMHHVDGAVMLGTVLLVVGLGMPITYFLSFFLSLNDQVKVQGLKNPKHVYTLTLSDQADGIHVENGREHVNYKWKQVHHVYRDLLATYLYITENRAFILPHTCIDDPDELWQLISKKVSADRCTDLRK